MLPYQTNPDESDWDYGLTDEMIQRFTQAQVKTAPFTGYFNVSYVDGNPATPFDFNREKDFFVLQPGTGDHRVAVLSDFVAHQISEPASVSNWNLMEIVYYEISTLPGVRHYQFPFVGSLTGQYDGEAESKAPQTGSAAFGFFEYQALDFTAQPQGLYQTTNGVGILGPYTQRYYRTGKFVLYGEGSAVDVTKMFVERPGTYLNITNISQIGAQPGAGRYAVAVDQYEGVRDALWGPDWFDVVAEGFGSGPGFGILAISDLEWIEDEESRWSASGDAVLGLKLGSKEMLTVKNGTFLLDGEVLRIDGTFVSTIEGKERPLFAGTLVISVSSGVGEITGDAPGPDQLALAGLAFDLTVLTLEDDIIRLSNTSFTLPEEFAERAITLEQFLVRIDSAGVHLQHPGDLSELKLLNLVHIDPTLFSYTYDDSKDEILIEGQLKVGEESFFPDLIDASLKGGIRIAAGSVTADIELEFTQLLGIKGFGLDEFKLTLSTESNKVTGSGKFLLPFPSLHLIKDDGFTLYQTMTGFYGALPDTQPNDTWGIGIGVDLQIDPLELDGLSLSAILPNIPLWSTPFTLREIGASVANLASLATDPVTVTGQLTLEGINEKIWPSEINLEGSINKWGIDNATIDGWFFSENLVHFTGEGSLDWVADSVDMQINVTLLDGIVTAELKIKSDFDFNVNARGIARFALLGNEIEGHLALKLINDGEASNDYAAVWASISVDLPFIGSRSLVKGIKYTFDGSEATVFGAEQVPIYSSWVVDENTTDLMVTIEWSEASNQPVHTRVIVYDDLAKTKVRRVYIESEYAANGIVDVAAWSGPLGRVIYIDAPAPGLWDVEVLNPGPLGVIHYTASASLATGDLTIDAVESQDQTVVISYSATLPGTEGDLLFFADKDDTDFNGILIGSVTEQDGGGSFNWSVSGFAPGRYWIYATLEDGLHIPLSSYAPVSVAVNLTPNKAPKLELTLPDAVAVVGSSLQLAIPENMFVDNDLDDVLTIAVSLADGSALPGWLHYDSQQGTLSGTPDVSDAAQLIIRVTATDLDGLKTVDEFVLAVEIDNQLIPGNDQDNLLAGGAGDDTINGLGGDDTLIGLHGNDILDGGLDIDTAVFGGDVEDYVVNNAGGQIDVSGPPGEGNDTLIGVERLEFDDISLAFDFDGNAGFVAKLLGALLGKDNWHIPEYVGVGLDLLDSAVLTPEQLMQSALEVVLGSNPSHGAVVNLLYTNLVGAGPSEAEYNELVGLLNAGVFTQAGLGVAAADHELNTNNIGLVGLIENGLAYMPVI